nr:Ig-like domain-containing protein [Fodinibius salsisoli]
MLVILWAISCATPSSPTGGPRDEEGPEIIKTEPETGTTNFDERSIIFHFSEFVERSSLSQAIVVEPDIGIQYELDWGRKSVALEFQEAIPDSTTLIVTIETELRDTQGNEMASPQKVAVSTGSEIDKGKLFGRIIGAQTGEDTEGERILLYREPVDLTTKANYVSSTDTSGSFQFSYLSEGRYKAFWVDDRNRNKIWDPQQERAQPFRKEFVELAKEGQDSLGAAFVTAVDTTQPILQGVGLFSSQRLRMRFSENILVTDSASIGVTDTLGNAVGPGTPLYIPPNEPYVLFAQSSEQLAESQSYSLALQGVVDESGNALAEFDQTFTGSGQEDTTEQRIITRNNLSGYYPSDPIEVTYAKPIDEAPIRDSLIVVEGTELRESWESVDIKENILRIAPDSSWKSGVEYEFRIWDPIISDYRKLQPKIWHDNQMGKLNIVTEDTLKQDIYLEISNEEVGLQRDTVFTNQIEISSLPPLNYKVIAYRDVNGNGQWDYGQVSPYEKPEPYFIQTEVPVKRDFTGDLTIIFQ